jgi:Protease inhibitor Inh
MVLYGMTGSKRIGQCATAVARVAAGALLLAALSACASTDRFGGGQPDQTVAAAPAPPEPPPPPPPSPPPVDLAGKWKLSVAGGGACVMTFGNNPAAAAEGTVAPAGGCPGNFFTSRKWTFEHDMLIIRDHKSEVLVELSFADGHFAGQAINGGGAITLSR